jgi:hypothetical protein
MGRRGSKLLSLAAPAAVAALVASASPAFAQAPPPAKAPAAAPPAAPAAAPAAPAGAPAAPASKGPSTAAPSAESADPVERARVHYERGLQLFNEENYDAALFEFERAYELAPSYKILYNMGRIQRQQNNYAAAMRSYERYLREGKEGVPADRRKEVEGELSVLKPRVALVTVKVNIDGADVYSDDIPVCTATIESSCVGKSPLLTPIIVNGGRHKITATKQGYAPATSLISVVGSDVIEVKLDLVSYDRPAAPTANPWTLPTVVGWSATGLAGAASIITGVLALNAKDKQETKLKDPTASADDLKSARDKTQTLSGVTDVLFISTAVFAGVSTYLTIRMLGARHKEADRPPTAAMAATPKKPEVDLKVSPFGFAATGTF